MFEADDVVGMDCGLRLEKVTCPHVINRDDVVTWIIFRRLTRSITTVMLSFPTNILTGNLNITNEYIPCQSVEPVSEPYRFADLMP